jgi:hypothetical protein
MRSQSNEIYTTVFRFILVVLAAVVLIAGTTVFCAVTLGYIRDDAWDSPETFLTSLICGLIVWLFIAVFHFRKETQLLQIAHREQFLFKLQAVLNEMGYVMTSNERDSVAFHPSFHSFLFGGGIQVELDRQHARLTGPKVSLEIFRRRYRLRQHVDRVQQVLHDHRKVTNNLFKRVELRLRVQPDQLEKVRQNVVELLEEKGEVICELNILVQSESGIREETLEFQIREWLELHEIPFSLHKDLVQFVEVAHEESPSEGVAS